MLRRLEAGWGPPWLEIFDRETPHRWPVGYSPEGGRVLGAVQAQAVL